MGVSESDIHDVASSVKTLLQSDETKRHLHGVLFAFYHDLFEFYRNYKPTHDDSSEERKAVIAEHLVRPQTKEIEAIDLKKKPTSKDVKQKQELESWIKDIQEAASQLSGTSDMRGGRVKALIPDLIVETIEQKTVVILACYYHWLVDSEENSDELEQLRNEWARWVRAKPGPNAEPLGLQLFLGECANVGRISKKAHKRVRKWIKELGEKIEPVSSEEPLSGESLPELKGRILHWVGREYSLTDIQAKVMAVYVKEYLRDPEATLKGADVLKLEQVDSSQTTLSHIFGKGKHEAWVLFEQTKQGFYRLKKPSRQKTNT